MSGPILHLDLEQELLQAFKSNPRLKKVGQKISLTAEQVKEYTKCSMDPVYFIENYVRIITIDHGYVPFKLYKYQVKMLRAFQKHRRVIMKAARQSGKTQTTTAYLLWYVLFNPDKTAAVLANKEATAIEILTRIQEAYMGLPLWLQQGIKEWNKTSFLLENGSRIISSATASNAIRGFTVSLLYLDEYAHVPNNVGEAFFSSVYPTLSSGKTSQIIISSTPHGMNHFYKLFTEAENKRNKSKFYPIIVTWDQVPGRNKAWADEQIAALGEEQFDQEMNVEFMGSAGTLISGKTLRTLAFKDPIEILFEGKFNMYEKPIDGHRYILTADCSHGKDFDASAFTITDVTTMPYNVVARYKDNQVPAELYPNFIVQSAKFYNEAFCLIENNDIGALVLKIVLEDLEYENVFYTDSHLDYKDTEITNRLRTPGLRTTSKTKRQGCNAMKQLVERNQLNITDFDIISELATFVVKNNKTYAADEGSLDDLAMCLVNFAWLTTQDFFKDLTATDMKAELYKAKQKQIADEMPVAPVLVDPSMPKGRFVEDGCVWEAADNVSQTITGGFGSW